ncbi:mate efflux family protein 2 chloroplastic [Phtheirospermum japonicum]|uniref:Mate efflux family protein 2 chloroplastic n=1 Tax=Phtheirospermum japonicum TaxID=374723 RepID=A0A830D6N8_9LAMI|nr:mate efflux family protein 2 chloroplastic [Phtheirospermum japonicum]
MGVALGVILFLGFGALSSLFSTDSEVLRIARSGTLFVAGSQPMNAIAFVLDGLYYGVSDFGFAAYSMVLVGLISSAFLLVTAPSFGLTGVWGGLFLFMTLRVVAGVLRLGTRSGPWRLLWPDTEKDGATFDHRNVYKSFSINPNRVEKRFSQSWSRHAALHSNKTRVSVMVPQGRIYSQIQS